MRRYLIEGVGTFFLALAAMFTSVGAGLMLMAMIYIGGHISGGYFNPAVSLGVWLRGRLTMKDLFGYWALQCVGALIAGLLYHHVTGTHPFAHVFNTMDSDEMVKQLQVFAMFELLLTFVFTSVILAVGTTDMYRASGIAGLVIGLTLTGLTFFSGIYNPALFLGAMLCTAVHPPIMGNMFVVFSYVVCPLIGAAVAGYVFKHLHPTSANSNQARY